METLKLVVNTPGGVYILLISSTQVFTGHSGPVRCGSFTPDGKLVVTGGGEGDNSLKVWDPKNGSCTLSVMDAHNYHSAGRVYCRAPNST